MNRSGKGRSKGSTASEDSTSRKGRLTLSERICGALDIQPDSIGKGGLIEIRGRSVVSVCGGGRILVYTPDRISIELYGTSVTVKGSGLVCISYNPGAVGIEGVIDSVCFDTE